MLGMSHHTPEGEARTIRDVARAIAREIQTQGHICVKAEQIATIGADLTTLKATHAKVCDKLDTVIADVAHIRGERKMAYAGLSLLSGAIGGLIALLFGK